MWPFSVRSHKTVLLKIESFASIQKSSFCLSYASRVRAVSSRVGFPSFSPMLDHNAFHLRAINDDTFPWAAMPMRLDAKNISSSVPFSELSNPHSENWPPAGRLTLLLNLLLPELLLPNLPRHFIVRFNDSMTLVWYRFTRTSGFRREGGCLCTILRYPFLADWP